MTFCKRFPCVASRVPISTRCINNEVARLRLAAAKEKQMTRQLAINLNIKAQRQEQRQLVERL